MRHLGICDMRALTGFVRIVFFACCANAPSVGAADKSASDLSGFVPSILEQALLPKYCWGAFNPKFRGPGMEAYSLPTGGCGGGMNHFCPALVSLNRAKKAISDPSKRGYWLGVARGHIEYTLTAVKDYPACPLRQKIEQVAIDIRTKQATHR